MSLIEGEANTQEHQLRISSSETLHYWTLGNPNKPLIIMQHGMRDVGRSLLPVAEALSDDFYCVLPDLRGHGKSFKPGSYAITHYLMDLRRLHQSLSPNAGIHLLGHSLGGHITCRYSGLFPNEVETLTVIEGLGPPPVRVQGVDETKTGSNQLARVALSLDRAIVTASRAQTPRVMPSLEAAAKRLQHNNPRLARGWAMQLAQWSTQPADGGLTWAFDPRAQEVFLGVNETVNFDYWRAIKAKTLVVTGDLGYQYWAAQFDVENYSGHFSPDDWSARLDALRNERTQSPAIHEEIVGAGHQVHYDQPEALAAIVQRFLTHPIPASKSTYTSP